MARTYIISEICGDWALQIREPRHPHQFLYFNSENNADLVKSILEWEDAHPNKAVPYNPTLTPPNEWVSKEPNAGLTDFQNVEQDTIDAIKMLRAELEQVQRERDAAVEDLRVCSMGDLAQSKTACCIRAEYVCAGVTTGCSATLRIPKSKSPKFCIKMGLLN